MSSALEIFGIPVRTSKYLGGETGYGDWRQRLERWLAPTARIPKREPLTKRNPGALLLHPTDPRKSVVLYCSDEALTASQRDHA